MTVHALVPVKDFARAKSRLAVALAPEEREALARSMAAHVLGTLASHARIASVTVAASSEGVASFARSLGHDVVFDPPVVHGLADVVDHGLAALAARGAGHAIVLMSDLPNLAPSELDALLEGLDDGDLVVALDAEGLGTNALALPVPPPFPSCFGHVDSGLRHLARAAEHGLRARALRLPGLEHDLDGPDGLPRR